MMSELFHQILHWLQAFLYWEPIDTFLFTVGIIFDRAVSITVITSILYGIIIFARHIWGNKVNPYIRYLMWYILIAGVIFARSPLLSYKILNPIYATLDSLGASFYNKSVYLIISELWLVIVITKLICYWESRKKFVYSLRKYTTMLNSSAFVKAKIDCGIKQKISVRISKDVKSPASFGITEKFIIIPDDYKTKYTGIELYYLFLHELNHFKNKDTCKNMLMEIVTIIFWFNPLINRICKDYKDDCEVLCDLAVVQNSNVSDKKYGELLLKELYVKNHVKFTTGFNNDFRYIKDRLIAICNFSGTIKKKKYKHITIGLIVIFIIGINIGTHFLCAGINANDVYMAINYKNGTYDMIRLDKSDSHMKIRNDKIILDKEYIYGKLEDFDKDDLRSVEIVVPNITVGFFAEYSRGNGCTLETNFELIKDMSSVLELPLYNNVFDNIYSHLLKVL